MATPLEGLFGMFRRRKPRPTETVGAPGTAVIGGQIAENERRSDLFDREKYRTFSEILANTSIVAAGVRYFLNLTASSGWTFKPADVPEGERYADLAEECLTHDPSTSWARIVRRAAMFRFYGFGFQEWTIRRRDDGVLTFADVAPRPQVTIERWDMADDGTVLGVEQRNPQNMQALYLPRSKMVYLVDDTLSDSPAGLGLFRHIVKPAKALERYEQLEGFGFEGDLRGIPVGRAPYTKLRRMVADGDLTQKEAEDAVRALELFIQKHIKTPQLGLLLDSAVYEAKDEAERPSGAPEYGLELLQGASTSLPDMARSIDRINREIARVLGVEALMLGDGNRGSHALSKDKTQQFTLTVNATLDEIVDAFRNDLLVTLWQLNGWPEEAMPEMSTESVEYKDIEQITGALRDMAQAGAPIAPDDPVIEDVRGLLNLSLPDRTAMEADMALAGQEEDELPADESQEGRS